MKIKNLILSLAFITVSISACKKDGAEPETLKPTAENVEIGTANNKRALRGRDFHFNADILAASKIKDVKLVISQKAGQNYASIWKFELSWPEYIGVKNTNVHKHFIIPATAPEGTYNFAVIVQDENGSQLEIKEDLVILDPANLPVDPKIGRDFVSRNGTLIYYTDVFEEKELIFKKGDEMSLHAQVSEIKDDGILYSVLIKKKANYYPESIDKLDLSKVIVVTKVEHKALGNAGKVSTLKLVNGVYGGETITVGSAMDNNEPSANSITGEKAWESGQYQWVILYKNTTHNISVFKSVPITISYN
ncbi:protein of unknown function [Pedobacter terrae]|uniref:DUF4625 domain-containing protein n=1 Tax=Pedobacter terrae TaxID=405671 RepID=A0A1G7VP31_9SPHI|nr:DUF4625 domain-containing protein [Pedobacter terrae]SDG61189.1 protein of unknown function [Pedobacter terrae]